MVNTSEVRSKAKSKPLMFQTANALRKWLECGTGKGLLKQLIDVKVAKATEHLTGKIEEQRLLQRQSVVVVLEPDGQLREVYGTSNVSVIVRALLEYDKEDGDYELCSEEYLLATLPVGIRRALGGLFLRDGKVRSWPILNQTVKSEELRLNKLAVLRALRSGNEAAGSITDTEEPNAVV